MSSCLLLALRFPCCCVCSSRLLLAVLFLTSCRSALTRCGSALLASYLLDHLVLSLLTCASIRRCCCGCLTFLAVCLSACATFSWLSVDSLLANCSLVYSMLTHVLRVVCWTDQYLCTSLSVSGDQPERGRERASRVFCFGLWGRLSPKLSRAEIGTPALPMLRPPPCWSCARGQWALLDTDMLVLIDWSARLVEPYLHLCQAPS